VSRSRSARAGASSLNSEAVSSITTPIDLSSDDGSYSTPATSKVPTPLDSKVSTSIEVHLPSLAQHDKDRALKNSKYSLTPKARKEYTVEDSDANDDDFSDDLPDAKVARRLQKEEFGKASCSESSLPPVRRSSRASNNGDKFSEPIPSRSATKRERANTNTATANGRPWKKNKVIPDSEDGPDSDINMDAELAAAAAFEVDNIESVKAEPVLELSDSDSDELSELQSIYEISSDDEPLSNRKGKQPAKRRAAPASRQRAGRRSTQGVSSSGVTTPLGADSDLNLDVISIHSEDSAFQSVPDSDAASDDEADAGEDQTNLQRVAASRRAYRRGNKKRAETERDRLESHHPELKTMWTDLKAMPLLNAGMADQPPSISRRLKPFQLEGLAWMKEMEKTPWKGGLLGDEMGLGKTIQAVSLIMSDYPAKQPSLVLVPPVALMQWQSEIKAYTDGTLKTFVFHGTNLKTKGMTVKDLKKYDVIMMSYNSLESIYRKQERGFKRKDGIYKEKSIIHAINFHRIILDEAHCIKTRTTMTAKACFALSTNYRWCLTGTPLQNRIGEFFSLIRFLNIRPFASYLCKKCECSQLQWSMNEDSRCNHCDHGAMQHVSVFNQELLNPIQKFGNMGPGREAFRKLRLMTERIMLRRLKRDHTNSMELPVKEVYVDRQFFGEEENDLANSIMTSGQRKFDTYVAQGVLLNNYANIFGLIMQMRQVADHPDLILKKNAEGGQNVLVCCICDEPAEDTVRSRCKHDFCRSCVASYVRSAAEPDCPRCHISLAIDLEQPEIEQDETLMKKSSIINRIKMENWTSSSKIELLVHELHKLRSDNASHKCIVFSQFTTMLQLIEWRLRRAGITTVMLDGSMTPAQRQASIEHFMNNVNVECFLVSLKAGGVALNLTEASRVFIVDP
jgi:DNA repair protein RAD16